MGFLKKVLVRVARQSPAMIVAMLALFVALTGTAVATTSALIGSAQIRNNSITGLDVKNRSLRPIDFRGSVRGPRGLRGLPGATGATGAAAQPARKGDKVLGDGADCGAVIAGATEPRTFGAFRAAKPLRRSRRHDIITGSGRVTVNAVNIAASEQRHPHHRWDMPFVNNDGGMRPPTARTLTELPIGRIADDGRLVGTSRSSTRRRRDSGCGRDELRAVGTRLASRRPRGLRTPSTQSRRPHCTRSVDALSGASPQTRVGLRQPKGGSVLRNVLGRMSPAMAVAMLALFVALSGTAVATTSALITGRQIKNGSITGLDVKNKSLTPRDFRGSVRGPTGLRGATGAAGAHGAKGDKGDTGGAPGTAIAYALDQRRRSGRGPTLRQEHRRCDGHAPGHPASIASVGLPACAKIALAVPTVAIRTTRRLGRDEQRW